VDPTDGVPGLDPGAIPPVPDGFTGELVCVEVDESGAPTAANSLKGEATIGDLALADVSKSNAIAIQGIDPDSDLDLELNDVGDPNSPGEYNGCPEALVLNFQLEGGPDAVIDDLGSGLGSQVNTALALVPCSQDFDNVIPSSVTFQFDIRNEFEESLSASTTITCWQSVNLVDISSAFLEPALGTSYGMARITSSLGDGLVGVASTRRVDTGASMGGTADVNLHVEGNNPSANTDAVIRIRGL
jgi:hypothetical protein